MSGGEKHYSLRWWFGLLRESGPRFTIAWAWRCWRHPSARLINPRPLDPVALAGLASLPPYEDEDAGLGDAG